MKVRISFHIFAEAIPTGRGNPEGGAGSAGGNLFRIKFYEFEKTLPPAGFRVYMGRLTKIMSGFSKAMDFLNNFKKMEGG